MTTKREVYLFGVKHHGYQLPDHNGYRHVSTDAREEFNDSVKTAISQHGIAGIAEEMSQEVIQNWESNKSVLCNIASDIGRPYHLCDRDPYARHEQREQIWICELNRFNIYPVLFVLGAKHVKSFNRLLTESGFLPFIIERRWKASSDQK